MSQLTDFDIVPVAPDVDLVLFDNVLSCYPCNKDLTATYTLGEAIKQTTWDWIGLFKCEWRYMGEYVAYCWASRWSTDCTAPRRRSVVFPSSVIETSDDWKTKFQLLYVSHGNHVVGVSPPFRMGPAEYIGDFYLACLFREPEVLQATTSGRKKGGKPKGKPLKRPHATFEIIDEVTVPVVPKKRPCAKERITKIFHDTETFVNIPTSRLAEKFSIVKCYSSGQDVSSLQNNQVKIFDMDWHKKLSPTFQPLSCVAIDGNANIPSIQYPARLSLKTGPLAFLESIRNRSDACSSCDVARTLVSDLMSQSHTLEYRLDESDERLNEERSMQTQGKTTQLALPRSRELSNWYINHLQVENRSLRQRILQLETTEVKNTSKQQEPVQVPSKDWIVWEPRRVVRLKNILRKQQCAIEMLNRTVQDKNTQILTLKGKVRELKTLIKIADTASDKFQTLAEELNVQIKAILYKRAKEHTNEWRQFVRQFQETTTQTAPPSSPSTSSHDVPRPSSSTMSRKPKTSTKHHLKNKHMSKVLRCESQPKSKLHKEQAQAEQCPSCGLKFSAKADRHSIEEHIVFHENEKKRN